MSDAKTPQQLLEFWFGSAREHPDAIGKRMSFWFQPSSSDDASVREQFEPTMRRAASGYLTDWLTSSTGRLALILALDQAPRVIFRRQPGAFAHDGQALAMCLAGIAAGVDRSLGLAERAFFYMPLQHGEDPLAQQESIARYEALVADHPGHAGIAQGFLEHAREHAAIIGRFGRYPHRNEVLGRTSTSAEIAFLEHGPRYGQ